MIAVEKKKVNNEDAYKGSVISFSDNDYLKRFDQYHHDLMLITTIFHNYVIKRILVD